MKTYLIPNGVYDKVKLFVTVVLPAASVLYVGLAGIWGFPFADEVSRTVAVVYTFLCAVMGISSYTAKGDPDDTTTFPRHMGGE